MNGSQSQTAHKRWARPAHIRELRQRAQAAHHLVVEGRRGRGRQVGQRLGAEGAQQLEDLVRLAAFWRPLCVFTFLDKNRRYIGEAQPKRPPTGAQRPPHRQQLRGGILRRAAGHGAEASAEQRREQRKHRRQPFVPELRQAVERSGFLGQLIRERSRVGQLSGA
eukprot:COSAG01_NODE_13464_length_1582_cov_8.531826_1_plen_164_part_10